MSARAVPLLAVAALLAGGCTIESADRQSAAPPTNIGPLDRAALERAMGRPGAELAGGVLRFGMPRADLQVTVDGVRIRPAFALGSWIAFLATPQGTIVMGDLVLLDTELNPVLARLQEAGIEQTAIHHHLIRESPRVLYTHIHGHGDALQIAEGVRAALALTGTPAPSTSPPPSAAIDLDTATIAAALKYRGSVNGGVYQVGVPRSEQLHDGGAEVPPTLGLGTVLNFQPTGGGKAAITGDFVLIASEVNPVLRALRARGIEVTSLHNHLLVDEPRLFFMHFWAQDNAVTLARALRAALDSTNARPPSGT